MPSDFRGFDCVEIRFKGGRKEFFRNSKNLPLVTGDAVVVEAAGAGWHLGHISLKGELVRLQMRKKKMPTDSKEIRPVLRVATPDDEQRWQAVRDLETGTMFRARAVVDELRLRMKLSDVEYQADRTKALFYYSAEDRVDFRELIRRLADEFRVRVEMRQITLRQEAGRIGGIGICGRELCCSTWLTDFKAVSTTAARYQNLSLNPQKLAGQCGRLKCCLNFELDAYLDALKDIPSVQRPLQLAQGEAFLQKTDIFRRRMWFASKGDNNWVMLSAERVREVQEMNKRGEKPDTLLAPRVLEEVAPAVSTLMEGDLDRLDGQIKEGKRGKRKRKDGSSERSPERSSRPERAERAARPTSSVGERPADGAVQTSAEAGAAAEALVGGAVGNGTDGARPVRNGREGRENRENREPREGGRRRGSDRPAGERAPSSGSAGREPRPPRPVTPLPDGQSAAATGSPEQPAEPRGRRGAAARPLNRRGGRGRDAAGEATGSGRNPRPEPDGRPARDELAGGAPVPPRADGGDPAARADGGGQDRSRSRSRGRRGGSGRQGGGSPTNGAASPSPSSAD